MDYKFTVTGKVKKNPGASKLIPDLGEEITIIYTMIVIGVALELQDNLADMYEGCEVKFIPPH